MDTAVCIAIKESILRPDLVLTEIIISQAGGDTALYYGYAFKVAMQNRMPYKLCYKLLDHKPELTDFIVSCAKYHDYTSLNCVLDYEFVKNGTKTQGLQRLSNAMVSMTGTGTLAMFTFLLGADTPSGETLSKMVETGDYLTKPEIFNVLLDSLLMPRDQIGALQAFTLLVKSETENMEYLDRILQTGVNINLRSRRGQILPIEVAVNKDDPVLLQTLISYGADPDKTTLQRHALKIGAKKVYEILSSLP